MAGMSVGRVVRWPLWSWRNLVITAVAVLALLALMGRVTDRPSAAAASDTSAPPVASAPGAPPTTSTTRSVAGPGSSPAPAADASAPANPGSPVEVATAFVGAWAHPNLGGAEWLAGMKPWATTTLLSSMTGTDPTQVPATKITGDAALRASKGVTATVSVPTDGGRIVVELVRAGGRWRVDTLSPDDAPPGAPTPSLVATTAAAAG